MNDSGTPNWLQFEHHMRKKYKHIVHHQSNKTRLNKIAQASTCRCETEKFAYNDLCERRLDTRVLLFVSVLLPFLMSYYVFSFPMSYYVFSFHVVLALTSISFIGFLFGLRELQEKEGSLHR
jgi:hypothetical protein